MKITNDYFEKIDKDIIQLTDILKIHCLNDGSQAIFWESDTDFEYHIFLTVVSDIDSAIFEIAFERHINIICKQAPINCYEEFIEYMEGYSTSAPLYYLLNREFCEKKSSRRK